MNRVLKIAENFRNLYDQALGLSPKDFQTLVLCGVAAVLVGVIAITLHGIHTKPF